LTIKTIISRKSPIFNNLVSPFSYITAPKIFYDDKKWCMKATECLNASLINAKPSPKPKTMSFS
jgi:hypothetical protein